LDVHFSAFCAISASTKFSILDGNVCLSFLSLPFMVTHSHTHNFTLFTAIINSKRRQIVRMLKIDQSLMNLKAKTANFTYKLGEEFCDAAACMKIRSIGKTQFNIFLTRGDA